MAKLSTLVEDFTSGLGNYGGTAGLTGVSGGAAFATSTSAYPALYTTVTWDAQGSSIFAKVGVGPAAGQDYATIFAVETTDAATDARIICINGQLRFETKGVNTAIAPVAIGAYDAQDHAWWRMTFNAGATTCAVAFSPDGITWTTAGTYPVNNGALLNVAKHVFLAGYNGTGTPSGQATLDKVNIAGVAGGGSGGTPTVITAAEASRPFVDQPGGIGTAVTLRQGSATGARLKLTGVNVWGLPSQNQYHADFATQQWNARGTVVNTIKNWGANVVRLRVNAIQNAYNASAWGLSQATYIARIKEWCDLVTAQGMYVQICWWDAYYAAGGWNTRYTESFAMMTAVHDAVGDNPLVFFEIGNEPNNISWANWRIAVQGTLTHWRNTLGYQGLLIVDTINWSHSYSDAEMTAIEQHDASRTGMGGVHQLSFARHDYGNEFPNRTWDRTKWWNETGGAAVEHLISETEFGNYNIDTPSGDSWTKAISAYFASTAFTERQSFVGSQAFLFGPWVDNGNPDSNGMTNTDNITPRQGTYNWGATVRDILLVPSAITPMVTETVNVLPQSGQLRDTFADLVNWPAKYGQTSVVGGKGQILADSVNRFAGLETDVTASPRELTYFEAEITVDADDDTTGFFFGVGSSEAGTRTGWHWTTELAGGWRPVSNIAYVADTTAGELLAALPGTTFRLALARGASAARYGVTSPAADRLYMFSAPAGTLDWTLRYDIAAPGYTASGSKLTFVVSNEVGTATGTIDDVNVLSGDVAMGVPSAPINVTATRSTDATLATLSWDAPTSDGGSPVTGYIVTRDGVDSKGAGEYTTTLAATARNFTFSFLTNQGYTFSVTATNNSGQSPTVSRSIAPHTPGGVNLPNLSSVFDDFNDAGLDPDVWTTISAGITQTGGAIQVDQATTTPKYLLTRGSAAGQRIFARLAGVLGQPGDVTGFVMQSTTNRAQRIRIFHKDGVLYAAYEQGTVDPAQSARPYNATTDRYLSFRHDAATNRMHLEVSADAQTWTALARSGFAAPSWVNDVEFGLEVFNTGAIVAPPPANTPSAPTAAAVISRTANEATLSWSAPTSDGGSPILRYGYSRDGFDTVGKGEYSATLPATARSVIYTMLIPATPYTLKVWAENANGKGVEASVPVLTLAESTQSQVPGAPASSSTTNVTPTTMTLNWTPPANSETVGVTGYTVSWGGWTSNMLPADVRSMDLTNFVASTQYSISIYAHNAAGSSVARVHTVTTPAAGGDTTNPALQGLPSRVTAVYATGWGGTLNMTDIPASYNVIYPFAASRGSVEGSVIWGYAVPLNIVAARARGTRVIISTGGAGQGINFHSRYVSQNFIDSVVALNTRFGGTLANPVFDGLDFNTFEADATRNTPEYQWMCEELRRLFGANFIITSPPAPWNATDKAFCKALLASGAFTYVAPQYYDGPGLADPNYISGTGLSSVTDWVNNVAMGDASKIVVGFGISAGSANYSTTAQVIQAWNTIEARHPAIRGAFLWQHATDRAQNWDYATRVNPLVLSQ